MGDALSKRVFGMVIRVSAFLDYNMLVVNFKGMKEELFLCEGGGEIDWDMGYLCGTRNLERELLFRWEIFGLGYSFFMSDAEFGAELLFRWNEWVWDLGNLCLSRNLERSSFSAGFD